MSWRIAKISGAVAASGVWRIFKISGSAQQATGSWRITRISGQVSATPPTIWRIFRISGSVAGSWRLLKISGTVGVNVTPTVSLAAGRNIDPIMPVTFQGIVTNGVQPDSWSFHLGTTPGGTDLDSRLVLNGSGGLFYAPGLLNGGNIYLTATATKNGSVSPAANATYFVRQGSLFYVQDGAYRVGSPFYTVP